MYLSVEGRRIGQLTLNKKGNDNYQSHAKRFSFNYEVSFTYMYMRVHINTYKQLALQKRKQFFL